MNRLDVPFLCLTRMALITFLPMLFRQLIQTYSIATRPQVIPLDLGSAPWVQGPFESILDAPRPVSDPACSRGCCNLYGARRRNCCQTSCQTWLLWVLLDSFAWHREALKISSFNPLHLSSFDSGNHSHIRQALSGPFFTGSMHCPPYSPNRSPYYDAI